MIPSPSGKDLLFFLALVAFFGGGFIFVFIPWLWRILMPLIHQATGQ